MLGGGVQTYRKSRFGGVLMALLLVFGVYMINVPFSFVAVPELFGGVHDWIIFAGGVVMIFAFFSFLQRRMRGY